MGVDLAAHVLQCADITYGEDKEGILNDDEIASVHDHQTELLNKLLEAALENDLSSSSNDEYLNLINYDDNNEHNICGTRLPSDNSQQITYNELLSSRVGKDSSDDESSSSSSSSTHDSFKSHLFGDRNYTKEEIEARVKVIHFSDHLQERLYERGLNEYDVYRTILYGCRFKKGNDRIQFTHNDTTVITDGDIKVGITMYQEKYSNNSYRPLYFSQIGAKCWSLKEEELCACGVCRGCCKSESKYGGACEEKTEPERSDVDKSLSYDEYLVQKALESDGEFTGKIAIQKETDDFLAIGGGKEGLQKKGLTKRDNWSKCQRFAISTQLMQKFGIDTKKERGRTKVERMTNIIVQMINGTRPLDSMVECDSDKALSIVNAHREILGIGPYCDKTKSWDEYIKERKNTRAKKGKGRTAKIPIPKPDGMSDEFAEKDPVLALEYFNYCLGKCNKKRGYMNY